MVVRIGTKRGTIDSTQLDQKVVLLDDGTVLRGDAISALKAEDVRPGDFLDLPTGSGIEVLAVERVLDDIGDVIDSKITYRKLEEFGPDGQLSESNIRILTLSLNHLLGGEIR